MPGVAGAAEPGWSPAYRPWLAVEGKEPGWSPASPAEEPRWSVASPPGDVLLLLRITQFRWQTFQLRGHLLQCFFRQTIGEVVADVLDKVLTIHMRHIAAVRPFAGLAGLQPGRIGGSPTGLAGLQPGKLPGIFTGFATLQSGRV